MAWNNANELLVGGTGAAYVAPVGTALPTTPTGTLNAAFVGLGYHTEDGVSISVAPDITEFMAWQSRQAVRRELNAQEVQVTFGLEQFDEDTVPFALGGGAITDLGGGTGYKYELPDPDDGLTEKALIVDVLDGAEAWRFVFPRGNVTEAVEMTFNRSNLAVLPITFKAMEPTAGGAALIAYTNSTAFAAGS